MFVIMGETPTARWVVNWCGNRVDADRELQRARACNYPNTKYRLYRLTEVKEK